MILFERKTGQFMWDLSTSLMSKRAIPTTERLWHFAKPSVVQYSISVALAAIGSVAEMVPYVQISQIIYKLLNNEGGYFNNLIYALIGFTIHSIGSITSTSISHMATFRMISTIRKTIADKLSKVSLGFIYDTPSGMLKDSIVEKVDAIEPIMAHAVPEMSSNLLSPLIMVLYCFYLDWRMGFASIISIPIAMICFAGMMSGYEEKFGEYVKAGKIASGTVVEYINGIEVIKAFNQSAKSYEKYTHAVTLRAKFAIEWMKEVHLYFSVGMGIGPSVLVSVLPIGSILYYHGSLKLEDFITIMIVSQGIVPPLIHAMSFTDYLAKIGTIVDDFGQILDQPEMIRPEAPVTLKNNDIVVQNVSFAYKEEEVIHNLSLSIPQGKIVALVGPSGGGKSTIAKLISSQWDVSSGSISIGGHDLRQIPLKQLAKLIGYVSQDCYLFNETIRNNIRMGNPTASDADVEEIAKESGCYEFISSLENGFETVVGDAGGHLSGGERQRIAIARCMMKNSPFVILDEATAYIDPENEAIIQKAIAKLVSGKTLIVIAHRLSTIVNADSIFVIENGQTIAQGTHEELLEGSPVYKAMWEAHIGAKDV